MRVGVLGTGAVGTAVGTRLVELGHEVRMGSRSAQNQKASTWVDSVSGSASFGDFADAAAHAELVINCTAGVFSLNALRAAGADNLANKVLLDIANPLRFSDGAMTLAVCNEDSLGEQIQREFPEARVVKGLNTVTSSLMLQPSVFSEPGIIPICGNDSAAKDEVSSLLQSAGWPVASIIDLGDITKARATEAYLLLWVSLFAHQQSPLFNISIVG